jgi:hypothetical protein
MMKRREESTTIDGIAVETTQYSLRESLQLQAVLAKLVLPVLAKLEGASLSSMVNGDGGGRLGSAFMQIAEQLEEDQLWPLVCRILACTRVKGTDKKGPRWFELTSGESIEECIGELSTLYKILGFVLKVNFKKSFSAASSALPAPAQESQASPEPQPSPTTSE